METHGHGVRAAGWDEANPEIWPGELSGAVSHVQLPVSGRPHQESVEYLEVVRCEVGCQGGNIEAEFT